MSDQVAIALITGGVTVIMGAFNLASIWLSRWKSKQEHQKTQDVLRDVLNGSNHGNCNGQM
jgi:hypothetical protein